MIYKNLFNNIKSIVNDHDPLHLLGSGAPDDEYEQEVASIVANLKNVSTKKDLDNLIIRVFKDSFGIDVVNVDILVDISYSIYPLITKE